MRQAEMHNHQTEVVGECVCNEEPATRKVLEPDLWLVIVASVHQSKSTILDLCINVKCSDVLST